MSPLTEHSIARVKFEASGAQEEKHISNTAQLSITKHNLPMLKAKGDRNFSLPA